MAAPTVPRPVDEEIDPSPGASPTEPPRPRRRVRRVLLGAVAGLALLVVIAGLWFFLGREQAAELSDDQAVGGFRAGGGASVEVDGGPAPGVYAATATGNESIGLPGFDEELGPNAPVTVTHDDDGCFTYRADFNNHHWRSWTFCRTDSSTSALAQLDSWTARKAPGLDIATQSTYTCDRPLPFLWDGAAAGDTRTGACTGTSDVDDLVTEDEGVLQVLGTDSLTIGGKRVEVVHVRTTDTFSGDQTGTEVGEWWLDAATGLPVKVHLEARLEGGPSTYSEELALELSTLTPAT